MGKAIDIGIVLDYEQRPRRPKEVLRATAGEALTGKILITVNKENVKGGKLLLELKGQEQVYRMGQGGHDLVFKHTLLAVEAELQDWRGQVLNQGDHHEHHFSIPMPDDLPQSVSWFGATPVRIQYKMKISFGSFTAERLLEVASRPLESAGTANHFLEPKTVGVKAMGMRSVGSVTFGGMAYGTHVCKGKTMRLALACRNDSTADISRVEVKLVETVHCQRLLRTTRLNFTLGRLEDVSVPGLQKEKVSKQVMKERQNTPNLHETNAALINDALNLETNIIPIFIPKTAPDTYDGHCIQVTHHLEVQLHTKKSSTGLSGKIPLRIGFPAPANAQRQGVEEDIAVAVGQEDSVGVSRGHSA